MRELAVRERMDPKNLAMIEKVVDSAFSEFSRWFVKKYADSSFKVDFYLDSDGSGWVVRAWPAAQTGRMVMDPHWAGTHCACAL